MEGNRRLFGWIVLGLGILALLAVVRGGGGWHNQGPPWMRGPAQSHWASPHERGAGPDAAGQSSEADTDYARGYRDALRDVGGLHERRHAGPFFWPGGLFKLFFVGLLALLALKLLRRQRGPDGPPSPPPAQPGPERPPYTGETQQL